VYKIFQKVMDFKYFYLNTSHTITHIERGVSSCTLLNGTIFDYGSVSHFTQTKSI